MLSASCLVEFKIKAKLSRLKPIPEATTRKQKHFSGAQGPRFKSAPSPTVCVHVCLPTCMHAYVCSYLWRPEEELELQEVVSRLSWVLEEQQALLAFNH